MQTPDNIIEAVNCPEFCSGNGRCDVGIGGCMCDENYKGVSCDTEIKYGQENNSSDIPCDATKTNHTM